MAIRPNPIKRYIRKKGKAPIRNVPKALEEKLSKELTQSPGEKIEIKQKLIGNS